MSNLGNEALKSAESTLMKVAEAVLSGATLRIIVPLHDDRNIVHPDSLLTQPYVTEIVEALQGSKLGLKTYVEKHLIPVADKYCSVAKHLREKHDINPASAAYEEWRARLVDRADQYLQSEYFQLKNIDKRSQVGGPVRVTDPELEDLDILAAVAVLESANQIAELLVLSDRMVSCKLDAIIQLAELHSFCDTSFELLESEETKKAAWVEKQSKFRRTGHEDVREEIRNRLSRLIGGKDNAQYFHCRGKRAGRPKIEYIRRALQDQEWHRKTPGASVMRQEIRNFCANQ